MIYIYNLDSGNIISGHQDSDLNSVVIDIEIYNTTHQDKIGYVTSTNSLYKIQDGKIILRTPKERTEYLISIGELVISNTEKVDDNGKIIPKTDSEKYQDSVISESEYRNILYSKVKGMIYNKFNYEVEFGFTYNNLQFQSNEESTNRITKAVALVDKAYSITNTYIFPDWISNSKDANGNDIRYTFIDYNDFIGFSIAMGNFWQTCFFKAKNLCDNKYNLTTQELDNYNIDTKWNE